LTRAAPQLQVQSRLLGSSVGASDKWSIANGYGTTANNGNLLSQTIQPPGISAISQYFTYDNANRLLLASENPSSPSNPICPDSGSSWCEQFGYDIFGNRTVAQSTNIPVMSWDGVSFSATTNRITTAGWGYDNNGNLKQDSSGDTLLYDAENRQIAVCAPNIHCQYAVGSGTLFAYDGDGRRVLRTDPGGLETLFVYGADGQLALEYGGSQATSSGRQYLTDDQLGSTRVITGGSTEMHDYYPFGYEILAGGDRPGSVGYGVDSGQPIKFTGKEVDSYNAAVMPNLDYFGARYFSGVQGRFTSVDPENAGASPTDPQDWNAYAYVRNSPLRLIDPQGLDPSSPACYLDGIATSCGFTMNLVSSGAGVQCPDNQCFRYNYGQNQFQQFIAGAGGATGYVSLSELGQLNEWQGSFLKDRDFLQKEFALPAFPQQTQLEVANLAAHLGISLADAAKLIVTDTDPLNPQHPRIGGGNWNFAYTPEALSEFTTLAVNARVSGSPSLHLHKGNDATFGPYSHVDTADPYPWSSVGGLLRHFFVDLLLGNTVYATGIPRQ
jgi:RHS repeat-associated protein